MPKIGTSLYSSIQSGDVIVNHLSPPSHRFWAKVNKHGPVHSTLGRCWVWTGNKIDGYGQIMSAGKTEATHRFSWRLHFKTIPSNLFVLHKCDNPSCVNPTHLFLGTKADNAADRNSKGRQASHKGVLNGRAKLNESQVREIRQSYTISSSRNKIKALAKNLGVCNVTIYMLLRRQTWTHIT